MMLFLHLWITLVLGYMFCMAGCEIPSKVIPSAFSFKKSASWDNVSAMSDIFYQVAKKQIVLFKKRNCDNKYDRVRVSSNSSGQLMVSKDISKLMGRAVRCSGVLGVYKVDGVPYLGIVTKSEKTNGLFHNYRKVMKIELVGIPGTDTYDMDQDIHQESLNKLRMALSGHALYFSTHRDVDVTRTIQSSILASQSSLSPLPWRNCDTRFLWNHNALQKFVHGCQAGASEACDGEEEGRGTEWVHEWVLPVVNAWISTSRISVDGKDYGLNLISRRSRFNQGVR